MTILSSAVGNVGGKAVTKSVYIKAARLRAGVAAGSVVDPERIEVKPSEAGVLTTPELQPGPAVIMWGLDTYYVMIPPTGTVSWWSVLALAVGVPPNTSEAAIAEALQVYLDANPVEGNGLTETQIASKVGDSGSPLGQSLAEHYVPDSATTGYDIVMLLGQSNARGQNADYDTTNIDVAAPGIYMFPGSGPQQSTIQPLAEPLRPPLEAAAGLSFAGPFARMWKANAPVGRKVLVVPCAVGGCGFTAHGTINARWKVGEVVAGRTNLYENAIAQATAALAASGLNSRIVAVLWHGGEADSNVGLTQAAWTAEFDALFDGMRTRLPALTTTPWVLGQMAPERLASQPGAGPINLAHIDTPARKPLTAFAPSPAGFAGGDSTHFSAAGQRKFARAFFAAIARAQANVKGVFPAAPLSVRFSPNLVEWTPAPGRVTDYVVEVQMNPGGTWATITHSASIEPKLAVTGTPVDARVSAVNECGTSDPTKASIATSIASSGGGGAAPDAPAKPVVVTPSTTSLYAAAPAAAGATGYTWEYKKAADPTWTTGPASTNPRALITGLDANTRYDVRAKSTNANGSSAGGTVATVATSNAGSALAFGRVHGLRRVVTAYTGPLVRVRRSSDSTELNIGQSGNDLDLDALMAFVGTDSAYVVTEFDQSGNGRDITQATVAAQPRIVNAGVIESVNSRPSIVYDGTDDFLASSAPGAYAAGSMTMLGVLLTAATAGAIRTIFSEASTTVANTAYNVNVNVANSLSAFARADSGTAIITQTTTTENPLIATGALNQFSVSDTADTMSRFVNGTSVGDLAHTRPGGVTPSRAAVGVNARSAANQFLAGSVPELAIAYSALSGTDRDGLAAAQKAYYGTP